VPSSGDFHSSVGTAFDYLTRFRIARDAARLPDGQRIAVHDGGWAAEDAVRMMAGHPRFGGAHARWGFLVAQARVLHAAFVSGRETSIDRVARCCQYLGAVDLLLRIDGFNPAFRDRQQVQDELLALDAVFDPIRILAPRESILLNPTFAASWQVGGADADLIVDSAIIDTKTTNRIGVSSAHLRQLVGYAILYGMGGPDVPGGFPACPSVDEVGIYFSRYGCLVKWRLADVLPGDGLVRFAEAFRAGLADYQAEQGILPPEAQALASPAPRQA
jgi:hypothetical protein